MKKARLLLIGSVVVVVMVVAMVVVVTVVVVMVVVVATAYVICPVCSGCENLMLCPRQKLNRQTQR